MKHFKRNLILILSLLSVHQAYAQCDASFSHYNPWDAVDLSIYNFRDSGNNGLIYQKWDFGDGDSTNFYLTYGGVSGHVYKKFGIYQITRYIWDSVNSCRDTFSDTIHINCIKPSFTAYHKYSTSNFGVEWANIGGVAKWSFGNGDSLDWFNYSGYSIAPRYIYKSNGKYRACFYTEEGDWRCKDTFCDSVEVNYNCIADFKITINKDSFILSDVSTNAQTFSWKIYSGNSLIGTSSTRTFIGKPSSKQHYAELTITDASKKCTSKRTKCIFPDSSVKNFDASINVNREVDINTFIPFQPTQIDWGDGNTTNLYSGLKHKYNTWAKHQICISTPGIYENCPSMICDSIDLTTLCSANFNAEALKVSNIDSFGTNNRFVRLSAQQQIAKDLFYKYYFGDGDSSTEPNKEIFYQYKSAGQYKITRIVSDSGNTCTDTVSKMVDIKFLTCEAKFESKLVGDTFVLVNKSQVADSIWWEINGQNHLWSQQDTIKYSFKDKDSLMSYVRLYVVSDSGQCVSTVEQCLQYQSNVNGFETKIVGNKVELIPRCGAFGVWDYGDGTASTKNNAHTYANIGNYSVCFSVMNANTTTCPSKTCDTLRIKQNCNADFTWKLTNKMYTFTYTDSSDSHKWYVNGNYIGIGNSYSVYDTNQSLEVSLEATKGYCKAVEKKCILRKHLWGHYFSGETHSFNSGFLNAYWDWNNGDSIKKARTFNMTIRDAGIYQLCLTNLDSSNSVCPAKVCDELVIELDTGCTPLLSYFIEDTVPNGKRVNIVTEPYFNRRVSLSFEPDWCYFVDYQKPYGIYGQMPLNTGYKICMKEWFGNNGDDTFRFCSDCKTVFLDTAKTKCKANYEVQLDTTQKFKIRLINKSSNLSTHQYLWAFGDDSVSDSRNPSHRFNKFGKYNIHLTVYDSVEHCIARFKDEIGLDSLGKLLKVDGFDVEVIEGDKTDRIESVGRDNSSIKVFPNPNTGQFTVRYMDTWNLVEPIKISLYDLNGQLIFESEDIGVSETNINMQNFAKGVYIMNVNQQEANVRVLILKQN